MTKPNETREQMDAVTVEIDFWMNEVYSANLQRRTAGLEPLSFDCFPKEWTRIKLLRDEFELLRNVSLAAS